MSSETVEYGDDCKIDCNVCQFKTTHRVRMVHTVEDGEDIYTMVEECLECDNVTESILDSCDSAIDFLEVPA